MLLALSVACGEAGRGARGAGGEAPRENPERPAEVHQTGTPLSPATLAIARGESLYFRGEIDSARTHWRTVLVRSERDADSASIANTITWLAIADWKEGKLATARATAERALVLRAAASTASGAAREAWRTHNVLGLVDWHEGRLGDAASRFERTALLARSVGERRGTASAEANMGLVLTELGELQRARQAFLAARDAAATLGDAHRIEGNALTNLAMVEVKLGDPASAIAALERAMQRYASIGYPAGIQNALGQLATAHAATGDFRRAFAAADSSLRMARTLQLDAEAADLLRVLAELHAQVGDVRRALALQGQARARFAAIGMELEEGIAARGQARLRLELRDTVAARRDGDEALRIHRAMGALNEAMVDLALLADAAAAARDGATARRHLSEARAIAVRSGTPALRLDVTIAEARVADRLGEHAATLAALGTLAGTDLERATAEQAWEADALRARAHARLGRMDSAAVAGERAIRALERARARLGSGELRGTFTARHAAIYGDQVLALLALGRRDSAFAIAEAARGRALLEHLAVVRQQGVPRGGVGATAAAEAERLRQRIDELLAALGERERTRPPERSVAEATIEDGVHATLLRRLQEARDAYEAHLARRGGALPEEALLGVRPADGATVRRALRPGEAMLDYLVTGDRVLLFVATRDTLHHLVLSVSVASLASRVRLARELVARRGTDGEMWPVLVGLHDLLVAPAYGVRGVREARRLILVPHGPLAYLPFAALRERASSRYLVQRHALVVLPSASSLVAMRAGARDASPVRRRGATPVALAPIPELLPATEDEARAFAGELRGARTFVGAAASEATLRSALAAGGVVHVASHAEMNARNPMFSRVQLARGERLEVHELLGLRVASPLVFLSGCETALGEAWSTGFVRGDDYATLAQAMLYAGARSVVATLWRIEDAGAATFAKRFYRHLRTMPPAEALAAAQRQSLRDPGGAAPYHWAAYQLAGEGGEEALGAKTPWWSVQRLRRALGL